MTAIDETRTTGLGATLTDGIVLVWRNLKRIPRVPDQLMWGTIQPIMFVLLFAYVFGGAIPVPGQESADPTVYREFLMGGIFAQTMAFAVASSSVGLAEDMQKGLIDRFRSLPIARSAVIFGRVVGDLVFNSFIMLVMLVCALLVGWRWHEGVLKGLAGIGILLLFAFAMLWIGAIIGLSVRSVEVAASAGLIWLFPITFVSTAFVPLPLLPSWLQPVAEWNPVSAVVASCRELFGNPNPFASDSFPAQHPVLLALIYIAAIIAIFAPVAVRKYKLATTR
ncbi:MAG: ABC transporter permease [Propionibacteriales bacterium]|nr:ABC transporter permease [Propionibacteriales bacterium]